MHGWLDFFSVAVPGVKLYFRLLFREFIFRWDGWMYLLSISQTASSEINLFLPQNVLCTGYSETNIGYISFLQLGLILNIITMYITNSFDLHRFSIMSVVDDNHKKLQSHKFLLMPNGGPPPKSAQPAKLVTHFSVQTIQFIRINNRFIMCY